MIASFAEFGYTALSADREVLLELQHYNLGIRTQSQRRAPSAGSARGEDLHLPDTAEAVHELPVYSPRDPTPGYELAEMGVT